MNEEMIRISVAVVTYNGERYIRQQLTSVLANLGQKDEVVISDDGSTDATWTILEEYAARDTRIRLFHGPGQGVIVNVEHALKHCRGSYIYLSDQDDVWMADKVETVQRIFEQTGTHLIVHDCEVRDGTCDKVLMESFAAYRGGHAGFWKNLAKNTYIGCCMAFRSELLAYLFPIPKDIQMHDQWIGVINDLQYKDTVFVRDRLIWYRRHGNNASDFSRNSIPVMIRNRLLFLKRILRRQRKY